MMNHPFPPSLRSAPFPAGSRPKSTTARLALGAALRWWTAGCGKGLPCRQELPVGSQLFTRDNPHTLYGRVVGHDSSHDFHNGMGPRAAAEIALEDGSGRRVWAACETIPLIFEVRGAP